MNAQQAWQATLGQLQMEMSKAAFDTWVRSANWSHHDKDTFTVGVQNAYARDWLESRLSSTVTRLLSGMMGYAPEAAALWSGSKRMNPRATPMKYQQIRRG